MTGPASAAAGPAGASPSEGPNSLHREGRRRPDEAWWRDAVVYEVYVRSFADADGDGIGDLAGVTSRLDYLADLGVDALWLTPFYRSPMADGGYDVADYRDVDPSLGTLADLDALVARAHEVGVRVLIDIVPNHCSMQHPWFQAAVRAGPGSAERGLFHFRRSSRAGTSGNGRRSSRAGTSGNSRRSEELPNNWGSAFSGPAWTQLPDGDWYLHLFAPEQPDWNWDNPVVRAEFVAVLRFWLDRGIDGIRIDVANGLVKAPGLPDTVEGATDSPMFDLDGVHEIYRQWRSIMDGYAPERVAVAEAWVPELDRLARYVRPGELHQAFNFTLLSAPWSGPEYREVIDASLVAMGAVGAPPTWVLSNHDVLRHATRLGPSAQPEVGLARARAATLLLLALPGSVYLYQGEELGLPEVLDLPPEARQDPIFARSEGLLLGRDGCRVPLPWSGTSQPYGFGPPGSRPWLPQPSSWARLSVEAQSADPGSTLAFYRHALRVRRALPPAGSIRWDSAPDDDVLVLERLGVSPRAGRPALRCVVNMGATPVALPAGAVLLASAPLPAAELPPDCAVWQDPAA